MGFAEPSTNGRQTMQRSVYHHQRPPTHQQVPSQVSFQVVLQFEKHASWNLMIKFSLLVYLFITIELYERTLWKRTISIDFNSSQLNQNWKLNFPDMYSCNHHLYLDWRGFFVFFSTCNACHFLLLFCCSSPKAPIALITLRRFQQMYQYELNGTAIRRLNIALSNQKTAQNCEKLLCLIPWHWVRKSFFEQQVWNLRQYSWNYFLTLMIFIRQKPKF